MKLTYLSLALAIISLVFASWSYLELINTKKTIALELEGLHEENEMLSSEILKLKQELISNVTQLNSRIDELEEQFETTIQVQQQRIVELNQSLTEFEALLADRISWIKSNANISNVPYYEITKSKLYKCYDGRINLGCIWFLLHDREGINYIYELSDQLTNLSVIYERKGGDCEDLSLLYAATVRYAMQKYGDEFVAWKPGSGKFVIYETSEYEYYMPDAESFEFQADHVYVTCYGSGGEGHCAVSFCKDEVSDIEDLYGCILIEPQSYGMLSEVEGKIWFYISADDLCMKINETETKCFSDFLDELFEIQRV